MTIATAVISTLRVILAIASIAFSYVDNANVICEYILQGQVAVFDPAEFAAACVDYRCENCRKHEAYEYETCAVHAGDSGFGAGCHIGNPARVDAYLSDESAGTHAA